MGKRRDLYEDELKEQEIAQEEKEMEKAPEKEMLVSLAETVRKENFEIRKEIGEVSNKVEALTRKEENFEKAVEEARGILNENLKKRDEKFASELAKIRKEIPTSQVAPPEHGEALRLQAQKISELEGKIASLQASIDGMQDKIAMALSAVAQPAVQQQPAPQPTPEHKPTTYERANPKEPAPVEIRTFYVCKAGDYSVCQESEELAREIANTIEPGKKHEPVRVAAWVDENGKFVRNLNATELLNLELVR